MTVELIESGAVVSRARAREPVLRRDGADGRQRAAAVYGPVDIGFAADGVIAQGELDHPGWVHATLDLEALAEVRANGQVRNHRDWSLPGHLAGKVARVRL